jgi:CRISPR system Cascade subunit CasD
MKALILRLDAPMVSFGGVLIDQHGVIDRFPGLAMLTGLVGNALGWNHGDFDRLQGLQARIDFAGRWDVAPQHVVDYHTVDLGQPKMREPGWTTRGVTEHRAGGTDARYGTHQRYRHYWMDGLMTVALTLKGHGEPDLERIRSAIAHPARPLFLGRKTCLPARPLLDSNPIIEADDVLDALRRAPCWDRAGRVVSDSKPREASWPAHLGVDLAREIESVYDQRDWANQLPAGSRRRAVGLLQEGGP